MPFDSYGVATISRLLKILGLFCKRALSKRRYSAKETYNFKEPTNRSHPISIRVPIDNSNRPESIGIPIDDWDPIDGGPRDNSTRQKSIGIPIDDWDPNRQLQFLWTLVYWSWSLEMRLEMQ